MFAQQSFLPDNVLIDLQQERAERERSTSTERSPKEDIYQPGIFGEMPTTETAVFDIDLDSYWWPSRKQEKAMANAPLVGKHPGITKEASAGTFGKLMAATEEIFDAIPLGLRKAQLAIEKKIYPNSEEQRERELQSEFERFTLGTLNRLTLTVFMNSMYHLCPTNHSRENMSLGILKRINPDLSPSEIEDMQASFSLPSNLAVNQLALFFEEVGAGITKGRKSSLTYQHVAEIVMGEFKSIISRPVLMDRKLSDRQRSQLKNYVSSNKDILFNITLNMIGNLVNIMPTVLPQHNDYTNPKFEGWLPFVYPNTAIVGHYTLFGPQTFTSLKKFSSQINSELREKGLMSGFEVRFTNKSFFHLLCKRCIDGENIRYEIYDYTPSLGSEENEKQRMYSAVMQAINAANFIHQIEWKSNHEGDFIAKYITDPLNPYIANFFHKIHIFRVNPFIVPNGNQNQRMFEHFHFPDPQELRRYMKQLLFVREMIEVEGVEI